MDTHQFTHTIQSLESLPEAVRTRALAVGEKIMTDEDREVLARQMTQLNERIRKADVEAEQMLATTEQHIAEIERELKHVDRDARELTEQGEDFSAVEKKMKNIQSSSSDASAV